MRKLLKDHWSLGENLTERCLATYGGHVYITAQVIRFLLGEKKEDFSADMGALTGAWNGIAVCLRPEAYENGTSQLVEGVCYYGFAPLGEAMDPRAQTLSKNGTAGVVERNSVVIGLSNSLWLGAQYGLVPSFQMTRLMFLQQVSQFVR